MRNGIRVLCTIPKKKVSKYRNEKAEVDGIVFDSKAEARRYWELKALEKTGEISHLTLQPEYILQEGYSKFGKKIRPIKYIADFEYCEEGSGRVVAEDVKGFRTKEFQIKKKIFEEKYPTIELRIIEHKSKKQKQAAEAKEWEKKAKKLQEIKNELSK